MPRFLVILAVVIAITCASGLVAQTPGKYAGADNCKMCHPDIHTDWSKSSHARAFELLTAVGEEKNAECLACHATGFGKGGFVDAASTPGLKGVTCEACHGPSADHMGDKSKTIRVPSASVCGACHQKLNIHSLKS